jgi:uncharacterized protein YfaS (alpha-2-macroglobulin family)
MSQGIRDFLRRPAFWILVIVAVALAAVAVGLIVSRLMGDDSDGYVIPPLVEPTAGPGDSSVSDDEQPGLTIELSEGQEQPEIVEPLPIATGEPLTNEEIEAILARLPALDIEPGDVLDFRLPEDSLPPPLTGETIDEVFPVLDGGAPEQVVTGPLEVLRYAPEGEIPIAPFVNVTFNQPMVPLTTLEDLTAEDVPVIIEPDLPGTWRWLGTKTITFQYDSDLIDRLPMATEYTVTVPAGTESASGSLLAEAVEFSFNTPPPSLVSYYPSYDPQPLDPIIFVAFDQRVDPDAVLETIQVTADGQEVSIKLASQEEIDGDEMVSRRVERAQEGRWLAFRPREDLPTASDVTVRIGPGTPSAEGPLLTQSTQSFSFETYAPLRIEDHGCSWRRDDCQPLTPLFIRFNNPIDHLAYDDSMLRIEPELAGASVSIFGDTLVISGATVGQTTYRVTVDADIKDTFGQTLGRDEILRFRITSADPFLVGPDETLVTLDPSSDDPVLSLFTMNYSQLEVKIYEVEPSDWPDFLVYLREYQWTDEPVSPPGELLVDETRRFEVSTDVLTEVGIDLGEVMDGDYGQFIVIARPPRSLFTDDRYWETVHAWVQITQIGIDAFVDHGQMVVWTSALQDGSPLSDVEIESSPAGVRATTGRDGVATFPIPSSGVDILLASQGADQAFLPRSTYFWSDEGWVRRSPNDELRWYVIDDRQMYRPDEEAHVKGWLRKVGATQTGDVGLVGGAVTSVSYTIIGPQGNELGSGIAEVTPLGGFDFDFTLPENANLGYARIELQAQGTLSGLEGTRYNHSFQIQEFRRPEFEVTARNETTGPYFVGEHAVVAVEAAYYAGGPLPSADTTWQLTSSTTNYQPPNWPDFTFGSWIPWWWYSYEGSDNGPIVQTYSGTTDASGNHFLRLDFVSASEPSPYSVLAEATVFDVNRQAWAGTTSLLVHPADLYVGMRSERYFVERGTPLEIDLIVTDLDGIAVADRPIHVEAVRLEWTYRGGWIETEADLQECNVGSTLEPVSCSFETPIGGRYRITATVTDAQGRSNQSRMTRWVSGGQLAPSREVEQEEATLIPDKETYQPGDVAEILVQSPFSPAEGLLTVSRSGILYTERFEIQDGSTTLEVPIESEHIPNIHIQVDLVGAAPRTDDMGETVEGLPPRPAYAQGQLVLDIPPLERTLSLEATPRDTALEPGGETTIDILLKDDRGRPVPDAEIAVIVVDEAVLALTNYQLTDPINVFYRQRPSGMSSVYGRASIVLADPMALLEQAAPADAMNERAETQFLGAMPTMTALEAPSAGMAADEAEGAVEPGPTPIQVRMDFNPLATFAPEVRTDAGGEASVEVTLPDNLTRYRIMVVAVDPDGSRFGSAEANLTARLPLMVRPSAPRFLNFGDQFELPVVLQNQTHDAMVVEVVVEAGNLELTDAAGLRVTVPADDRIEVRFPSAAEMAGTARLRIAAVSGEHADAAQVELPVYTPATTEAFATYGVLDEGAVIQPIGAPSDVFPQFGGLEIQTSSTALQALTDAVLYLTSYPFECTEQISSRILGIAALRDVLTAFEAEGLPSPQDMEEAVVRDITRLEAMQNYDGGWPSWRRGRDSIPFNTIHVAHALQRAELKGFTVSEETQERVLWYLRDIESHYPAWYSLYTRRTLSAYALFVRDLMGDGDAPKARRLLEEAGLDGLSLDAIGWIWEVLVDDPSSTDELEAIRNYVNNRVVETAGAANFTIHYHDQTYLLLSSNRRTDAILMSALIGDNPQSDLIPKLVNGLLAHRTRGHWGNTQENIFVLLALDRYFNTFEAQTPDFVARIWLGDTYAGDHTYEGYTTERHETNIPMVYLVDETFGGGEMQDLVISKQGTGRLYYRLGLRYAPTDLDLPPVDMGFVVQRSYEAVDDPEDVYRDDAGVWHVKAGARVRIRIMMVADNRRYHVALVDPLPAGLEIINPALAVSGSIPQDPDSPDYRYGWWWWWTWYEHQNMRDERAEAFTTLLWDGVYDYTYVARATTPGTFVVPPAKAEEMYSPEVFGRSGGDVVIVE